MNQDKLAEAAFEDGYRTFFWCRKPGTWSWDAATINPTYAYKYFVHKEGQSTALMDAWIRGWHSAKITEESGNVSEEPRSDNGST